ncbi:hypothetical protein C8F01DRAFT_985242, partial [Mycena amicta]
ELTEQLWKLKYKVWPKMGWGLILGCNVTRFNSRAQSEKDRLYAILVSTSWHLIWRIRLQRRIDFHDDPERWHTEKQIHNMWVSDINYALKRDCILTNRFRFGPLAFDLNDVLRTWSGILAEEDSLSENWINEGVLVGIRPIIDKRQTGIG